jgi:hypothetical protein
MKQLVKSLIVKSLNLSDKEQWVVITGLLSIVIGFYFLVK